jgi:hypothetical protein
MEFRVEKMANETSHGICLVELVEKLKKIEVTPENITKNQNRMGDNNGGYISF